MKRKSIILKNTVLAIMVMVFSSVAFSKDLKAYPKSENAQKIAKLKQELANARGQKKVKLIKKIAEMENKVLEHKLQSFR